MMRVDVSHHVDASEPNAEGLRDYHYEYDVFTFSEGAVWYAARVYSDAPHAAAFMTSDSHQLSKQDLHHPLFIAAAAYLRAAGKTELSWLSAAESRYILLVAPSGNDEATFRNGS